jgi:predicted ArsR family transcriptional regulator
VKDTYKIKDLEQVRLLTDPLKLQLVQAFAESAKTTKQVAAELGESVTKLYRHVDALHDSGLLVLVDEKQKRGTVERTFRAVAQRFEADHSLFADEAGKEGAEAAREMLRVSEAEILGVLAKARDDDDEQAIIMRIRGKASPEKIAELRATLKAWLDSVPGCEQSPADNAKDIGGLIAFYQID